jgi:hypothetical protein
MRERVRERERERVQESSRVRESSRESSRERETEKREHKTRRREEGNKRKRVRTHTALHSVPLVTLGDRGSFDKIHAVRVGQSDLEDGLLLGGGVRRGQCTHQRYGALRAQVGGVFKVGQRTALQHEPAVGPVLAQCSLLQQVAAFLHRSWIGVCVVGG